MDELAILCKSYRHDLDRCASLVESLRRHNRDDVPFYLSVPERDRHRFVNRLGTDAIRYLSDEEVVGGSLVQSWVNQQLVKLGFARRGVAENYLWIDSDFVVLRDFVAAEFFAYPGIPFTVVFEAKPDPYWEKVVGAPPNDPEYARMFERVHAAQAKIRDWFGRTGPLYYFGSPVIWSSRVVRALEELMLERGLDFEGMLALAPFEMNWYGEFLLARSVMPLVPRGALAVYFTRDWQYLRFLEQGLTLEDFATRGGALAVNFASKWMSAFPVSSAGPIERARQRRPGRAAGR